MRSISILRRQFVGHAALVGFGVFASIRPADAEPGCPSAPSNWADTAVVCSVPGFGNICAFDPVTGAATCDVSGSDDDALVIMVSDYDNSIYGIKAWGEVYDGSTLKLFCCQMAQWSTSPVITSAEIFGSNHADNLRFTWTYGGSTYSQYEGNDDYVFAGTGSDTVVGSMDTNIIDWLYGENHHDTISGLAGADKLYGGDGDDIMAGGSGDDEMYGGNESDTMTGGDGLDSMYGDDDRDYMNGGANDDLVDGGLGPDVLCGGGEDSTDPDDIVKDGDTTAEASGGDLIWSSQVGDAAQCNANNTQWDWVAQDPLTTCVRTGPTPHPQYTLPAGATMPPACP